MFNNLQPKNLSFLLHDQCNLKCSYCWEQYNNKSWNKKLNYYEFTQIIDFFVENYWIFLDSEVRPQVKLGGGEIFLYADEALKMIDYLLSLKNIINPPYIILQTNGTCIPDAFFEKYTENDISLGLSLDGYPDLHNEQRDNSFDLIPIDKILTHFPKTKIYSTILKKNIEKIPTVQKYLKELGFENIQISLNRYETYDDNLSYLNSLSGNIIYNGKYKEEKDWQALKDTLQTIVVNPYGKFWICNHFPVSMPDGWGQCGNLNDGILIDKYQNDIQKYLQENNLLV